MITYFIGCLFYFFTNEIFPAESYNGIKTNSLRMLEEYENDGQIHIAR